MRNVFFTITERVLRRDKGRTLITLIGVIIAISLITNIVLGFHSVYSYLVKIGKESSGGWTVSADNLDELTLKEAREEGLGYGLLESVGYSDVGNSINPEKEYIYIVNMDNKMEEISDFEIISGRMAENANEIVLPEHLSRSGGIDYEIGDTITLEVGERIDDRTQDDISPFVHYYGDDESLVPKTTMTFTVVGICSRLDVESFTSAGYTAVTNGATPVMNQITTYFTSNDVNKIIELLDDNEVEASRISYNSKLPLLTKYGVYNSSSYEIFIVILVVLLLISIGIGVLICNTFAITNRERKEKYETVASIGATKRQMKKIPTKEGVFYTLFGVPLGILFGSFTSYLMAKYMGDRVTEILGSDNGISFSMNYDWSIFVVIAIICVLIIHVSISIPIHRAAHIKPIEEKDYYQLSERVQRRINRRYSYIKKTFGIIGVLATKNFKRSEKHYRFSILSMVMSIVLFVSTCGFSMYMENSLKSQKLDDGGYDILYSTDNLEEAKVIYREFSNVEGVLGSAFLSCTTLNGKIKDKSCNYNVFIIDDETFRLFLKESDTSSAQYFDANNPKAIVMTNVLVYNAKTNKLEHKEVFKDSIREDNIAGTIGDTNVDISVGVYLEDIPNEIIQVVNMPTIIMSETAGKGLISQVGISEFTGRVMFNSYKVNQTYNTMKKLCEKDGYTVNNLENLKYNRTKFETTLSFIKIFAFGFIIMMTIIAIANVFNSISADLDTRKIEFATLQAMGMSKREFKKMMYFECFILGFKTILYGMIFSAISLYLIYEIVSISSITGFIVPVASIIISLLCVIISIFVITVFASRKMFSKDPAVILKENMI